MANSNRVVHVARLLVKTAHSTVESTGGVDFAVGRASA